MVRSLNEIVYDIIESYRATYKNTDSLDERLVATWVQHYRAELIKQRLEDPMRSIDEQWVQDLGTITMNPQDSSAYPGMMSGKYMLRSDRKIPFTIQPKIGVGTFTRIAPADRLESNFNMVTYERALYSGYGKFNNKDVYAFVDSGNLCLISRANLHKYIKQIHVKGVFENPIEAYNFANISNNNESLREYNWDMEYPVSEALISAIKNLIKDKELRYKLAPMEDTITDGADTLVNMNLKSK